MGTVPSKRDSSLNSGTGTRELILRYDELRELSPF